MTDFHDTDLADACQKLEPKLTSMKRAQEIQADVLELERYLQSCGICIEFSYEIPRGWLLVWERREEVRGRMKDYNAKPKFRLWLHHVKGGGARLLATVPWFERLHAGKHLPSFLTSLADFLHDITGGNIKDKESEKNHNSIDVANFEHASRMCTECKYHFVGDAGKDQCGMCRKRQG